MKDNSISNHSQSNPDKSDRKVKIALTLGVTVATGVFLGSNPDFWKNLHLMNAKIPSSKEESPDIGIITEIEEKYFSLLKKKENLLTRLDYYRNNIDKFKILKSQILEFKQGNDIHDFSNGIEKLNSDTNSLENKHKELNLGIQALKEKISESTKSIEGKESLYRDLETELQTGKEVLQSLDSSLFSSSREKNQVINLEI